MSLRDEFFSILDQEDRPVQVQTNIVHKLLGITDAEIKAGGHKYTVRNDKDTATLHFDALANGGFTFKLNYTHKGQPYRTQLTARPMRDGGFMTVDDIIIDNQVEKSKIPAEIESVLRGIGQQFGAVKNNELPRVQNNTGQLTWFGRLRTRLQPLLG